MATLGSKIMGLARKAAFLVTLMMLGFVQQSWALPEDVEMDRYILAIGQYLDQGKFNLAQKYLKKAEDLSSEPPAIYHYYKALVARQSNQTAQERNALEQYVSKAGKDAEHYQEVLLRMTELDESVGAADSTSSKNSDEALIEAFRQDRLADDQAYVKKLQDLYLQDDPVQAIVTHINQMLATHAYTGMRMNKADGGYRLLYNISTSGKGLILLVEKDRGHTPERITTSKMSVYGQSPFIEHECIYERSYCVIKKPDTTTDWFKMGYSKEAAAELSEALSRLIHFLQR